MGTFARQNFSDELNIDTPEGVALRFPVAGIGSRGIALLVDHLIQGLVAVLIGLGVFVWEHAVGATRFSQELDRLDTLGKWFVALIGLALFLLWMGYFALFEAFWHGQTPGKRLMKLRVIKDAGRQITLFEALARNLLRIIDSLPTWYLAGVVTMICNRRNKRLGDLVAGTIVIHEGRDEQPLVVSGNAFLPQPTAAVGDSGWPARASDASALGALFPSDALARLGPNDLRVIETFFARALDLPLETRASMAQRIAATLCGKMGMPVPTGNPERALEAMLVGLRSGGRRF